MDDVVCVCAENVCSRVRRGVVAVGAVGAALRRRRCRRHGALCVHGVSVSRIEPIIVAQPLRSIQRKLQPMGHACNGRESVQRASGGHASEKKEKGEGTDT